MSSFNDRLYRVLYEMPVRHFKAAGGRHGGEDYKVGYGHGQDPYFKGKSYEGYTSPRYMEVVSDKLSRLIGYDINIFVIERRASRVNNIGELSAVTGLPVSELSDAVNFIMTGNNEQVEFSPWLYVHQLGEAIEKESGGLESAGYDGHFGGDDWVFQEFYDRIEELVPDWVYRLKMGSAREAKREGSYVNDLHQELITEFLWHGGRIRFDYPVDVGRREVDAVFEVFYSALRGVLDGFVGKVLFNDVGR